jgi:hypothetical protein
MSRIALFGALMIVAPLLAIAQKQQLAPIPPALPRTHTQHPTTSAIIAADLMTRLYIFADDSMMGRLSGTRGNAKGTAYLAAEARRIGLTPAGDSGTYFQNVPDPHCHPVLRNASMRIENSQLSLTQDFLPIGPHSLINRALAVVYGGRTDAPVTLTAQQTAGKLVVFSMPAATPIDSQLPIPSVAGAAAVALVALDFISPAGRATLLNRNMGLRPQPDVPVILLNTMTVKQLFGKTVDALRPGSVGKQMAVEYTFVASARNVIAILPGSDPVLRHEYVALGAHNDHLGVGGPSTYIDDHDSLRVFNHFASIRGAETSFQKYLGGDSPKTTPAQRDSITTELAKLRRINPPRRDSINNGADDDGSGSVALLEIAEQLAAMPIKPKRSILFVWHESEEGGSPPGSEWFLAHPTVPRDSIVAQLNVDMIGRGDASDTPEGGPNFLQVIGSRRRSTELGDLINRVNTEGHHNFVLDYVGGERYYQDSDQYEYAKYGIPVVLFFTGLHPDYHQVTDEPQYINYEKTARITSLINDVTVHLANLDHRPIIDHPIDAH